MQSIPTWVVYCLPIIYLHDPPRKTNHVINNHPFKINQPPSPRLADTQLGGQFKALTARETTIWDLVVEPANHILLVKIEGSVSYTIYHNLPVVIRGSFTPLYLSTNQWEKDIYGRTYTLSQPFENL